MSKSKHVHKFNRDGNNLWCECGAVKRLICAHKWRFKFVNGGVDPSYKYHSKQFTCSKCGADKTVDFNGNVTYYDNHDEQE